jgi:thiamine biosynthesis lipoprotein
VLVHAAVSTSGDAEQFVEIGGVRFSHIVDPATGLGLTQPVAVTVVARRATVADALATACSVLDPVAAQRLTDASTDPVRLIIHRRDSVALLTSP